MNPELYDFLLSVALVLAVPATVGLVGRDVVKAFRTGLPSWSRPPGLRGRGMQGG